MKTQTGLTIIHDGARINVYTPQELQDLNKQQNKIIKVYNTFLNYLKLR